MQDLHVVTICKVLRLPTLGHDIADIGDLCLGLQKRLPNFLNDNIGQNRCKRENQVPGRSCHFLEWSDHSTAWRRIIIKGIGHIDMVNHAWMVCNVALHSLQNHLERLRAGSKDGHWKGKSFQLYGKICSITAWHYRSNPAFQRGQL